MIGCCSCNGLGPPCTRSLTHRLSPGDTRRECKRTACVSEILPMRDTALRQFGKLPQMLGLGWGHHLNGGYGMEPSPIDVDNLIWMQTNTPALFMHDAWPTAGSIHARRDDLLSHMKITTDSEICVTITTLASPARLLINKECFTLLPFSYTIIWICLAALLITTFGSTAGARTKNCAPLELEKVGVHLWRVLAEDRRSSRLQQASEIILSFLRIPLMTFLHRSMES